MIAEFRVLADPEVEVNSIEGAVGDSIRRVGGELMGTEAAPLAFGITSLRIVVAAPEEEGITERLARALSEIEGVSSVEILRVTRAG